MHTISFPMLEDELWWGGSALYAPDQPYDRSTCVELNMEKSGGNQSAPFFLSTKGRYVWADAPIPSVSFVQGTVTVRGENPVLVEAGSCLRDAYLHAMRAHFPFEKKPLPEKFFRTAQYNTWMEFTYNPTQESVLKYAHGVVDSGYKPGILMIDEGWHVGYGEWEFDFHKFPDPKAMIDELHELGFTVMLWVVPYVTPDGRAFLDHHDEWISELMNRPFEPRLVRQPNGELALLHWWNGFSAVYNLCEEADRNYLSGRLQHLMDAYGVDGFKFDGGNVQGYSPEMWVTQPPAYTPAQMNKAWNEFGAQYTYHEYKDTYDRGGKATIQRICDRSHEWGRNGLGSLMPFALAQGLLGYPYLCPDMIGGGSWAPTVIPDFRCDEELFVRMAQCAALFPMMQFSWAPWRMLGEEAQRLCLEAAKLHDAFADTIVSNVNLAMETGEPIVRTMEYNYPHRGYGKIVDQFMLGTELLVCPVVEKDARVRKVTLPEGKWIYCDGVVYEGGGQIEVPAPLHVLPYFKKA